MLRVPYDHLVAEMRKVLVKKGYTEERAEQVAKIFQDARLFDPKKIVISKRHTGQKPEGFVPIVGELKLFIMVFQSFNSGRLDERYEEIDHIFKALKKARETWGKTSSRAHRQGVLRPAALKGHEVFGRIVACNL